jgi:tRNA G18 (ribose-2'-O)-methylase SpoU
MKPRIKTTPDLSANSPKHQEIIAMGNDHLWMWQRNVIDRFKSKSNEEIKQELQLTSHPFAVCFENIVSNFNLATGIRNCNAFNCRAVYYYGDKKFDKRGLQGCHNYTDITWLSDISQLEGLKQQYTFIGVDNMKGAVPITNYKYPPNPLFLFGTEGTGLTPFAQSLCSEMIYISQFGSIRSLNIGTASGIIMNDFVSKYRGLNK